MPSVFRAGQGFSRVAWTCKFPKCSNLEMNHIN